MEYENSKFFNDPLNSDGLCFYCNSLEKLVDSHEVDAVYFNDDVSRLCLQSMFFSGSTKR